MKTIQLRLFILAGVFIFIFCIAPVCGLSEDPSVKISYSSNCSIYNGGSLKNLWADGDLSYLNNETIRFSGENKASNTTYLFIIGPYLSPSGARLTNPAVAVKNNESDTFDSVRTDIENNWYCEWHYLWNIAGQNLQGTYTVFAVSEPLDKDHLTAGKYNSLSIIIRAPETPTPTKTVTQTTVITTIVTTVPATTMARVTTTAVPATTPEPTRVKPVVSVPTPWPSSTPVPESPLPAEVTYLSLVIGAGTILWKRE